MVDALALRVAAVVFIATLIRSSFGFGEALIAVPLLALQMPIPVAVPVAMLVSITVAAIVVAQDWREIHARSASWLLLGTVAGIPVGLWMLTSVDAGVAKAVLGAVIIAFAAYALRRRGEMYLREDRRAWLLGCGLAAGILGGAYGMNGLPLAVYGSLRRWSPAQFRATLQAYFLPASAIAMGGYWACGLWVPEVTRYFLVSLPGALVATLLGRTINRGLGGPSFLRYVYVGLILIGVVLLGQSLYGSRRAVGYAAPTSDMVSSG